MTMKEDALRYHSSGRRGKIEVVATKPCRTQWDLSMAYTPGVAEPCRKIEADPDKVYTYTAKGNLVAVVSNGTAVLGLGRIGPVAGKPVMEGKGVLFKRFADIDVFDLEVNTTDTGEFINIVKALEPTFGGINLEDIAAPDCFAIEERLIEEMNIPVFHDDQHGTAIISGAAFLNALELTGKDIDKIKVVYSGAGAAGIACVTLYIKLGVRQENVILCDSLGVIYKGRRERMNPYKEKYAVETSKRTLAEAMEGADVFVGVSTADLVTKEMVRSMNDRPIVFAMANPDPEITYEDAKAARDDVIMATGRSDYPNQVNNVLGFPFIFRGALDVRASAINEEMKVAAVHALADLAKEDVPETVSHAYGGKDFHFGPDYIIPKPFDPRVLIWEASAVAKAAMESGVAGVEIDIDEYRRELEGRLDRSREVMRKVINKATKSPKKIVFPEGDQARILKTCKVVVDEGIAVPILLGDEKEIKERIDDLGLDLPEVRVIQPRTYPKFEDYVDAFYQLRRRKGITRQEACDLMLDGNIFGSMMVRLGDADGLISGLTHHYPDTIRPALQVVGIRDELTRVSGMYMMVVKKDVYFFADATVNINPNAEELAEIAICCAEMARRLDIEPRIAMLSFSNFGSTRHEFSEKVRRATEIAKERRPDLVIDGEMQADTAVVPEIVRETYPFCSLKEGANVLIFPDLQSGNIAYKLLMRLGGAEAIGPILMGMKKSVHVLQRGCDVNDIVNMTAIAVVDAQEIEKAGK
jgi:malate dehydrogenase (oxaloacetate-decarboxylating)(NADP+)